MRTSIKVVLAACVAGLLGVAASLLTTGPAPLLRSELGQRLLGAMPASAPGGIGVARRGDPASRMKLTALDGRIADFPGDFAGKPVLVNLWASWCAPCRREMPELQRFYREQGANGTQVVGIALDDAASVRDFLEQVPVDYPILLDAPGPTDAGVRLGNTRGVLPYTVLLSADGRILKQRIGPFPPGGIDRWAK